MLPLLLAVVLSSREAAAPATKEAVSHHQLAAGGGPVVPIGTKVPGCCGDTDSHKGLAPCGKYPSGEFDEKDRKSVV